jgi:TrmH family RNA methyltransferase
MIRNLALRRGRERRGFTLAEGVRLVEEVVAANVPVRAAIVARALEATPRGRELALLLRTRCPRVEEVTDRELVDLAATEHPQGVIAVIEPRRWQLEDIVSEPRGVVLVLDAVQDPGNVGSMLRTCWALGGAGAIALPGSAELTNPKVLRSSVGAGFRLPCVSADPPSALGWIAARRVRVWVAAADGDPVTEPPEGPVALVVGNEGAGVGAALSSLAERRVAVPLRTGAESLNVGVAAGILLYEVLRER